MTTPQTQPQPGTGHETAAAPDEYRQLVAQWFGYSELRAPQERVLAALETGDVFAIAPTGSGKSMSYVLPALRDGKVLVVSPHIALMQDQVESLRANGVSAAFINSTLTNAEKRNTYIDFRDGKVGLLYTSPESLANRRFVSGLAAIGLNLLAIDEAHCVSEWGHTFRPEYLRLRDVRQALGSPRTIALTATATPLAWEDIVQRLGLEQAHQITNSVARENLKFSVQHALSNDQKTELLVQFVTARKQLSGIVYTGSRKRSEELAALLRDHGVNARSYHAGLDAETRRSTQREFMKDAVDVIVATNAFGLGVDKPDIRYIVHFDMPGRLEAYYQEAGRAGRDGEPAECELIYTNWTRRTPEYFIGLDHPDVSQVRALWHEILRMESDGLAPTGVEDAGDRRQDGHVMALRALQDSGLLAEDGVTLLSRDPAAPINAGVITRHMNYQLEMLGSMVEFATTSECRLGVVLRYFGEDAQSSCGRCDNCQSTAWNRLSSRNGSGKGRNGAAAKTSSARIHVGDPEWPLFDALRDWRKERADEDGVPAFVVFGDRVLTDLARKRPSSRHQLSQINGVGTVKLDRYGDQLLRVIAEFRN